MKNIHLSTVIAFLFVVCTAPIHAQLVDEIHLIKSDRLPPFSSIRIVVTYVSGAALRSEEFPLTHSVRKGKTRHPSPTLHGYKVLSTSPPTLSYVIKEKRETIEGRRALVLYIEPPIQSPSPGRGLDLGGSCHATMGEDTNEEGDLIPETCGEAECIATCSITGIEVIPRIEQ